MQFRAFSAVAMLGAVAAAAPAAARPMACAPVTTAAVEAQFAKFDAAFRSKDPDKVTALFAPGAVLLATVANQPRTTPAEIRDYFVGFLKKSPVGAVQTSTVMLGCNMAARVGTWNVTLTDPASGAASVVKARYSFIYKYVRGQWMIAHLHSSMMPEPTS